MKKYRVLIVLVSISLGIHAQSANQKEYAIIKALVENNWYGTGVLMGKEATFTMDWQNVLGNKFMKLEFENNRKSAEGTPIVFRATAFYKIVNDSMVVGNWFDNRGLTFPLNGSLKENEMTILWGNEETEMGKTIYRYTTDAIITVEDFILNNGQYAKFGAATYNPKEE